MTYPTVPIEEVADKLLTVEHAREAFSRTEPLSEITFSTGEGPQATFGEGWHLGELTAPAPVWLTIPGGEKYQLTKQAGMELASVCHITQGYQVLIPSQLLQVNVAWWLDTGLGEQDLKLLCSGRGQDENGSELPLAAAMCRSTISPFSNLRLLDTCLERIRAHYGDGEVWVDYKFHHDLERTDCRLIVPSQYQIMNGTGDPDDRWSVGVQFKNSPIGLKQTLVDGYLFRWICTNGQIDVGHSMGGFQRRGSAPDDVYEWAAEAVDQVLGGLEDTLTGVQRLTEVPVEGSVVSVLTDLFGQYNLPKRERNRVIAQLADLDGATMYDLMNEVTRTANLDGLEPQSVELLMMLGGHIAHVEGERCSPEHACRRLLPPGYVPPADERDPVGRED